MLTRIRNVNGQKIFVCVFSRTGFLELRKTWAWFVAVFAGRADVLAVISTASYSVSLMLCGFGWKAMQLLSTTAFLSHVHQIRGTLLHSLCTANRQYP